MPHLPGLQARLLEQAIEAGDLGTARAAAARLWADGDRRFDAQLVLIADAMRRSDWKSAQAFLAAPRDEGGVDVMGRLLGPPLGAWIGLGMRDPAPEKTLLAAAGRARTEPAFALEAALVQLAAKRPAEALALARDVTLTDRTSQIVALRLAASLDAAGRADAAQALRGRIALAAGGREDPLLLLPDQPVADPRAGAAHWLALVADALARTPNSNPRVSLVFARAAFWMNDGDWGVRSSLVETLARNGSPDQAMALLVGSGWGQAPPVLQMRRAELMVEAGDPVAGLRLAEAAAGGEAPPRSLLVRLADVARRSGDDAAAERAFMRLAAVLGDDANDRALRATLLIARADLRLKANDWDGAAPLIEEAVALRPADPTILNFAGYAAIERRRDVDRALGRIEAAWKADTQNPSITDSLGWAYFLVGRAAEAVDLLETAQAGEPDNAVIVEHLADAYWQAGRRFEARYAWRAAALIADADMAARIEAKLRDGLTTETTAP